MTHQKHGMDVWLVRIVMNELGVAVTVQSWFNSVCDKFIDGLVGGAKHWLVSAKLHLTLDTTKFSAVAAQIHLL